jgi:dTDP-4-dehydrorhamnose reductase
VQKILITGVSGFLGLSLVNSYNETANENEVIITGLYNSYQKLPKKYLGMDSYKVDITDTAELNKICQKVKPDIIIHCAALRDLEFCDENPELADQVNYKATEELVRSCTDLGSRLVFISTDMVFDGSEPRFAETSARKPVNKYGETKMSAEDSVMNYMEDGAWLIIRTSRLFGHHPLSRRTDFVGSVIEQLKRRQGLKLPIDEYRNNSHVTWCAQVIIELLEKNATGIYHVCGDECINKFDFGQMIAESFELPMDLIIPMKMEDYNSEVIRPKKVILDNSKLLSELGPEARMQSIQNILHKMAEES